MAQLNWSEGPGMESVLGKLSGAWVLKGTRMPVREMTEVCDMTEAEVNAVLHFAAESLKTTPAYEMPEG
jgi:hypothetical protein